MLTLTLFSTVQKGRWLGASGSAELPGAKKLCAAKAVNFVLDSPERTLAGRIGKRGTAGRQKTLRCQGSAQQKNREKELYLISHN